MWNLLNLLGLWYISLGKLKIALMDFQGKADEVNLQSKYIK